MFCAQIVGKPVTAPEPTAAPAIAAAPLRTLRRGRPLAPCDPAAPVGLVVMIWPPVRFSLAAAARRRPSAWASCLAQLRIGGERRATPPTSQARDRRLDAAPRLL